MPHATLVFSAPFWETTKSFGVIKTCLIATATWEPLNNFLPTPVRYELGRVVPYKSRKRSRDDKHIAYLVQRNDKGDYHLSPVGLYDSRRKAKIVVQTLARMTLDWKEQPCHTRFMTCGRPV